uniref:hypothetical protein n=1 Tax=Candidatus Fimivicinus sp. TaxID=3056640 RepID=UPI003FF01EA9
MTDVAKQSLTAVGNGLLKAKGIGATPGQVIAAPELSNNLEDDINSLREFNNALLDGATPAEAYADHLTNVSKAAQEAARQSNGLPVDIDKYHNSQLAASMATKVSTGSMIAQSVASAALTGAISMGVTLAVNGLITGLDYLTHAHERAVEAVDNANQAYAENETELNNASSSLAQVEERLNALNSIEHKSLAEEAETAELERQRKTLADQVALLQIRERYLNGEKETAAEDLAEDLTKTHFGSDYTLHGGKEEGMDALRNFFDPYDKAVSAEEFSNHWLHQFQSGNVDLSSYQFVDIREALAAIAEEYQKIADSSKGAVGDAAREKVTQISFAIGEASTRAKQFYARLSGDGANEATDNLVNAALAGKLTADNLSEIAGDDLARQLNSVSGSAQATVTQLIAMAQSGDLAKISTNELTSATDSLCATSNKITDIENAVNSQRSLSASQINDLCSKYPELKNYIVQTADGYRIQQDALSLLSGATDNMSKGYIQAQIEMTKSAIEGAKARVQAIAAEVSALPTIEPTSNGTVTRVSFGLEQKPSIATGAPFAQQKDFFGNRNNAALQASTKYQAALNNLKAEMKKLDGLENLSNNLSTYQTKSTSSGSTAYKNEALDNELKRIEHLKAIGKYENDELGYIKALENAKSRLTKKESERWQLEEKIYAAREAYEKQQLDDYLDEISYKEAMGKYDDNQAQKIADLTYAYNKLAKKKEDLRKLEQQIYKETKAYQEAEAKKAKDAADAIEDIVDMRMKYIRKEQELKKKALEDELDGYKKLYDAQAKALDKQKEADDYAKTAAKKRADIAEIETRLNELSADTSAASQREQAELRAELAEKQEDLEEYEKEQSIERQKEKLDEEYALLEEQNNAKIEKIDEFLDNEGAVRDQAMADIMTRSETVYQELMEWNAKYGDGINKTVTDAWKAATDALKTYGTQANAIKISENPGDIKPPVKTPSAAAQQKPAASSGGSSAAKAPVKGGRASVTTKDAAAYASSSGKRVGSWSTMAKNAGVGWNQKLYVTNIANGKVAIGTTSKIGNTIAWVDKKNVKGYRSGSPFIPSDQLALVDEAGPELIIRNPVQGRLTHLSRGDGVLNSTLTERIIALAQNPAAFLNQSMAKLSSAFGAGFAPGAAPCIQIDSKVIVEGNADMETVKALEKAENRIAEKVFTQANKKYLRSGHTINPKHLG